MNNPSAELRQGIYRSVVCVGHPGSTLTLSAAAATASLSLGSDGSINSLKIVRSDFCSHVLPLCFQRLHKTVNLAHFPVFLTRPEAQQ